MDKQEIFPDGTVIDKWFYDITIPELSDLGKQYVLTDYNILDDGKILPDPVVSHDGRGLDSNQVIA